MILLPGLWKQEKLCYLSDKIKFISDNSSNLNGFYRNETPDEAMSIYTVSSDSSTSSEVESSFYNIEK